MEIAPHLYYNPRTVLEDTQLIILAAGKGTRMESSLPKALTPLAGKPMISRLLDEVAKVPFSRTPIIVVGHEADMVKNTLGKDFRYAHQKEQLGTGHAVFTARAAAGDAPNIMVLFSDQPFVDAKTLKLLARTHRQSGATLTMATVSIPDFDDWRSAFERYGRIIRDTKGRIKRIVEYADATESERRIKEVNPAYLCCKAEWLWEKLGELRNNNAQKEYYLTRIISTATNEGVPIADVPIKPRAALGANTGKELETLERLLDE